MPFNSDLCSFLHANLLASTMRLLNAIALISNLLGLDGEQIHKSSNASVGSFLLSVQDYWS